MGKFRQISTELWPLIDVRFVFIPFLWHFSTDFFQHLHESYYLERSVLGLKMGIW